MTAGQWVLTAIGLAMLAIAVWYLGFLGGRRYESGIWEHWLDEQEAANRQALQQKRVKRRIVLNQMQFKR